MERTKMRIHSTILLIACELVASLSATEYVFSSKCICNGSLSDLQLHATVDYKNQSMKTYFTGIATNFSEQALRAYPKIRKNETECNRLDNETLRNETAESDITREQNLGEEDIHKHWLYWRDLDPTTSVNETRSQYNHLFTGCYFFEYKPADQTCSTCYTNPVFINTSMEYVSLLPVQEARRVDKEHQLIVTIPLQQMQIIVLFYEHSNESQWGQRKPTVTCRPTWSMSRNETVNQVNKVCDGNVSIAKTYDNEAKEWAFRMRWYEDQNFRSVNYTWNLDSHPTIFKLFNGWEILTRSSYPLDKFAVPPLDNQQFDPVWIIIVGAVGLVMFLCIALYCIRDRMKKNKKKKKKSPEVEAVSEDKAREPLASDILLLYAPGDAAFQQLIRNVQEVIRMHCQCRVYDYLRIPEYCADWTIGPTELVNKWFNYTSNKIVWFDTPQLRDRLRLGSNKCTSADFRETCLWNAYSYALANHLDITVLATRHFVCRIKGIPEYAVTNESDLPNPLSWITRGVHYYLPDHMTNLLEMLSGKDITKDESLAENKVTGQDTSNEEERKRNGYKNDQELGNNLDTNGRNGYFSKKGYETVSTNDNDVKENNRLNSMTSGEIDLRQPLRDPDPSHHAGNEKTSANTAEMT